MDPQSQKRLDAYRRLVSAREAFHEALKQYTAGSIPNEEADTIRDKLIVDMDRALSDLKKAFGHG